MATTDDATTRSNTWPRLIRGQFGLRFLLAMMFVAALVASWHTQLPIGTITKSRAEHVHKAMTRAEVQELLGKPQIDSNLGWLYKIQHGVPITPLGLELELMLVITFGDDDRVTHIDRTLFRFR